LEEKNLEGILSREPSPEFALQLAEEYQRLLRCLDDHTLRSVALWKMEGQSNNDIAARLGCAPRTVTRKLHRIRVLWSQEIPP
jgi:DNA-directed RNA polymerase specialized sigma24 family protein